MNMKERHFIQLSQRKFSIRAAMMRVIVPTIHDDWYRLPISGLHPINQREIWGTLEDELYSEDEIQAFSWLVKITDEKVEVKSHVQRFQMSLLASSLARTLRRKLIYECWNVSANEVCLEEWNRSGRVVGSGQFSPLSEIKAWARKLAA